MCLLFCFLGGSKGQQQKDKKTGVGRRTFFTLHVAVPGVEKHNKINALKEDKNNNEDNQDNNTNIQTDELGIHSNEAAPAVCRRLLRTCAWR